MFKTQTVKNTMGSRNEFLVIFWKQKHAKEKPKPAVWDMFYIIMK